MLTNIRLGSFETNSSSSHSIIISKELHKTSRFPKNIQIQFQEFGWEVEEFINAKVKTSYIVQYIIKRFGDLNSETVNFKNISIPKKSYEILMDLKSQYNKIGIKLDLEEYLNSDSEFDKKEIEEGYIDHQAFPQFDELITKLILNENFLRRFLQEDSVLITGTDEDSRAQIHVYKWAKDHNNNVEVFAASYIKDLDNLEESLRKYKDIYFEELEDEDELERMVLWQEV